MRCLSLFNHENGQLTPIVVQAPGGGFNPQFNAMFAQNLGFGPPPPGAQPMPPPQQGPQHNVGAGHFDLGGGHQLHVKINGKTPEGYLKDKASSMIWGWVIGAVIIGLVVLTFVGVGIYVAVVAKDSSSPAAAAKAEEAASWDGKSPFSCSGNDVVALKGVTATAGVTAGGNCQLTLTNVNITAPIGIEASANAKVTMKGGSITATTTTVAASSNAKVDLVGAKISGPKPKTSANGKVTGAN